MDTLFANLLAYKPRGWSVVRGVDRVIVRPRNRSVGKFVVHLYAGKAAVMFFSASANRWIDTARFWPDEPVVLFMWCLKRLANEGEEVL